MKTASFTRPFSRAPFLSLCVAAGLSLSAASGFAEETDIVLPEVTASSNDAQSSDIDTGWVKLSGGGNTSDGQSPCDDESATAFKVAFKMNPVPSADPDNPLYKVVMSEMVIGATWGADGSVTLTLKDGGQGTISTNHALAPSLTMCAGFPSIGGVIPGMQIFPETEFSGPALGTDLNALAAKGQKQFTPWAAASPALLEARSKNNVSALTLHFVDFVNPTPSLPKQGDASVSPSKMARVSSQAVAFLQAVKPTLSLALTNVLKLSYSTKEVALTVAGQSYTLRPGQPLRLESVTVSKKGAQRVLPLQATPKGALSISGTTDMAPNLGVDKNSIGGVNTMMKAMANAWVNLILAHNASKTLTFNVPQSIVVSFPSGEEVPVPVPATFKASKEVDYVAPVAPVAAGSGCQCGSAAPGVDGAQGGVDAALSAMLLAAPVGIVLKRSRRRAARVPSGKLG